MFFFCFTRGGHIVLTNIKLVKAKNIKQVQRNLYLSLSLSPHSHDCFPQFWKNHQTQWRVCHVWFSAGDPILRGFRRLSSACTPSATAADKTGSRGSLLACATVKMCIVCFFVFQHVSWVYVDSFEVDSCWADPLYQKKHVLEDEQLFQQKHISLLFWSAYHIQSKLPGASDGAHTTFLFGLNTTHAWQMQSQVSGISQHIRFRLR